MTWICSRSTPNDNPVYYVQYAHARTAAVARNAAEAGVKVEDGVDTSLLDSAADGELLAVLGQFPAAVRDAAKFYEPHRVNRYLEQLASAYHSWYGVSRVTPRRTKRSRPAPYPPAAEQRSTAGAG